MTKNICILGDSHTACFKNAWNNVQRNYKDVSLTFFADRGVGISGLEPRDGALVPVSDRLRKILPVTSGGLNTVDLKSYDAVWLIGFVSAYPQTDGYFSNAVIRQELLDAAATCPALNIAGKIRQIGNIPIFIAHRPLMESLLPETDTIDVQPYRSLIQFLNERIFADVGATVLEQPEQTITNDFYTRPEYSNDAARLDIGDRSPGEKHAPRERKHMNEKYGAVYLSTRLATIAGSNG